MQSRGTGEIGQTNAKKGFLQAISSCASSAACASAASDQPPNEAACLSREPRAFVPVPIKGAQEAKIAPDAIMDARGSRRARRGL